MEPRFARVDDAAEIVRLARVMFASMGADMHDASWETPARRAVGARLGGDLGIFVVDHPDGGGRLVASAAGTIATRLPTVFNHGGRAGYVQWVCTDEQFRGLGLGRAVVSRLLDWYAERDVPAVELHATAMGEPLYRSLGFDDDGPVALRRVRGRGAAGTA